MSACAWLRGCGSVRLWLEPPLGCRCAPISHVTVPNGGGVVQLWTWGGSVLFLACLIESDRNLGSRVRSSNFRNVWACVCSTVSVTRRSRSQVQSPCMFQCSFDLSKPSTSICTIPICTLLRLKITSPPPNIRMSRCDHDGGRLWSEHGVNVVPELRLAHNYRMVSEWPDIVMAQESSKA
jgi:hypothetical protein